MKPHVSGITLGVADVSRAKKFYNEGLGWPILHEQGPWLSFSLGDGSSTLGVLPMEQLAADAGVGVTADGNAFRGVTLSYVVTKDDRVAEVLDEAERAGGTIVKAAERAQWGGCTGYFADPDGYFWKVAAAPGSDPTAAE